MNDPSRPLIIQGDLTVLVEVDHPRYADARECLAHCAELVKSPEHVHSWRITALSVWNTCAIGKDVSATLRMLAELSRFPLPETITVRLNEWAGRWGKLTLERSPLDDGLVLQCRDAALAGHIRTLPGIHHHLGEQLSACAIQVPLLERGKLKVALTRAGYPVDDRAGFTPGEALSLAMRKELPGGAPFALRDYQHAAVDAFLAGGSTRGGSGVLVLACGAGKTVIGLAAAAQVGAATLVLTTSTTAVRQWISEALDKTTLTPDQIGAFDGTVKDLRPVTVATYHILTHRDSATGGFPHLDMFQRRDWGLIIYDEVHQLPAPIFQVTAGVQARRRLGLTATLVREDQREAEVFALIGPKRYDSPWRELESQGWIASARCTEVRLPLTGAAFAAYCQADPRRKLRAAAENPAKLDAIRVLLARHPASPALVIGTYVDQLGAIADSLDLPLLTGSTPQPRRDALYADFRAGRIRALVVSKVANFAVDLPDAALAIEVSGSFGSRQEEAQRLGRLLRPKPGDNVAHFYTLVSADTIEQDFALNRQRFLCEQGYHYAIVDGIA